MRGRTSAWVTRKQNSSAISEYFKLFKYIPSLVHLLEKARRIHISMSQRKMSRCHKINIGHQSTLWVWMKIRIFSVFFLCNSKISFLFVCDLVPIFIHHAKKMRTKNNKGQSERKNHRAFMIFRGCSIERQLSAEHKRTLRICHPILNINTN